MDTFLSTLAHFVRKAMGPEFSLSGQMVRYICGLKQVIYNYHKYNPYLIGKS